MWAWLILLAMVVFFMYMWGANPSQEKQASCNTCPYAKNVSGLE